jgi:hypothetical protein
LTREPVAVAQQVAWSPDGVWLGFSGWGDPSTTRPVMIAVFNWFGDLRASVERSESVSAARTIVQSSKFKTGSWEVVRLVSSKEIHDSLNGYDGNFLQNFEV